MLEPQEDITVDNGQTGDSITNTAINTDITPTVTVSSSPLKKSSPPPQKRPAWKPDNSTDCCTACSEKFNLYMRKHHCRNCGEIYCSLCCGKRVDLKHLGYKEPERVCSNCVRKYYSDERNEDIHFFSVSNVVHQELAATDVSQ